MRILLIGATGFIGPHVIRDLIRNDHTVAVYSRACSPTALSCEVFRITGDRAQLRDHRSELTGFNPQVVVDFILSSERQARALIEIFRGLAERIVALSSADVYRAAGILHHSEQGPLQAVPLGEDSDLRTNHNVYGPETIRNLKAVFPWLDDEYDKIPVERAIMSDPDLPGTILRLPMVYGPGDRLHRLFPYLKRMDDGRPAILLPEDAALWQGPRGYVENVASAIALAVQSPHTAGRIYNIAEPVLLTELDWVGKIARCAGWHGSILSVPKNITPPHLQTPYNYQQHWSMSSLRIRRELGYKEPIDDWLALERTIEWERNNPPGEIDAAQFDYAAEDEAIRAVSV
jgi:nucleoside-diphosphate-sugar epimerase